MYQVGNINSMTSDIREVQGKIERLSFEKYELAMEASRRAWLDGRQIFIMGRGGSASTASIDA